MPTTMVPQAKKLAKDPPVALFKQIVDNMLPDVPHYGTMVYNSLKDAKDEEYAIARVGSTCDLNATGMMAVAVGAKRYSDMVTASNAKVEANKFGVLYDTRDANGYDHAHRFKPGEPANLQELLTDWCGGAGSAAMQVKFSASSDWHTLTLERVPQGDTKPNAFVVYQAYQGTYRLLDFIEGNINDDTLQKLLATESTYKFQKKYPLKKAAEIEPLVKGDVDETSKRIEKAVELIGGGQQLSLATLNTCVIEPLIAMLKGGLEQKRYVEMTASATDKDVLTCDVALGLLIADKVDSASYDANYTALIKPAAEMKLYPEMEPHG